VKRGLDFRRIVFVFFFLFFSQKRLKERSVEELRNEGLWHLVGENEHLQDFKLAKFYFEKTKKYCEDSLYFLQVLTQYENISNDLKTMFCNFEDRRDLYVRALFGDFKVSGFVYFR
jgi:hypothetical protein